MGGGVGWPAMITTCDYSHVPPVSWYSSDFCWSFHQPPTQLQIQTYTPKINKNKKHGQQKKNYSSLTCPLGFQRGIILTTAAKLNIGPEKWCLEDDPFLLKWSRFRGHVSFRRLHICFYFFSWGCFGFLHFIPFETWPFFFKTAGDGYNGKQREMCSSQIKASDLWKWSAGRDARGGWVWWVVQGEGVAGEPWGFRLGRLGNFREHLED